MPLSTEEEKYEILEKIGPSARKCCYCFKQLTKRSGQGSFGVIRKVRRKDNGQVRSQFHPYPVTLGGNSNKVEAHG